MQKKKKVNYGPFGEMMGFGAGMAGMGITTAVVAGVDSKLPAGSATMSPAMNTMAGFMPVMGTAIGGKAALKTIKKLKF